MAHVDDEHDDFSPPFEESDILSPGEQEPEPEPGLNGTPVHCKRYLKDWLTDTEILWLGRV